MCQRSESDGMAWASRIETRAGRRQMRLSEAFGPSHGARSITQRQASHHRGPLSTTEMAQPHRCLPNLAGDHV